MQRRFYFSVIYETFPLKKLEPAKTDEYDRFCLFNIYVLYFSYYYYLYKNTHVVYVRLL